MSASDCKLKEAIAFHQADQIVKAKAVCDDILAAEPNHAGALHLLGVMAYQANNCQHAIELINRAIEINSTNATFYASRGNAFHACNQLRVAIESYDCAISIQPDYAAAYFNRGLTLHELKQFEEAIESYNGAINIKPDFAAAYFNRGNTQLELKNWQGAMESFDRAITIKPDYAEAYHNRGNVLRATMQFEEAVKNYDCAISMKPDYAIAHFNRGFALQNLKQFEAAIESYNRAIKIKPDFAEAYFNRGFALQNLKQFEAAIENYDYFINLKPDDFEAYMNRGNALRALQRLEESVESFDQAIALNSSYAEAYFNRGLVLHDLKKLEKAVASYDHAIAINPNHAEAYWSKSLALLSKSLSIASSSDLEEGWELYEWRAKRESTKLQIVEIPNKWNGEKTNRSLLVLSEQGLGDKIFYAGMLNDLRSLADNITVCVEPRLIPLYQRSFEHIKFISIISEQIAKTFDTQIYMPSLGRYFRSNIPALQNVKTPYLKACPEKTRKIRTRLEGEKKLICGLSWVSKNAESGSEKSLSLQALKPILTLPDIDFVDLQYGDTTHEQNAFYEDTGIRLKQIPEIDNFQDIDGLASLIDACDMIVTISNTTAHLAGALGKNVIIMLPYSKGLPWYWHEGNGNSPWYPTARLFRQDSAGDWEGVKAQVKLALENTTVDNNILNQKK